MTRAALLGLLFSLTQLGCTVTAVSATDDRRPRNSCSESNTCDGGNTCRAGMCQTLNGVLEAVLLEASPPSDSNLPHLTFVTNVDDVLARSGAKDLTLPSPVQITGRLNLPPDSCYPDFISPDKNTVIVPALDMSNVPVTATFALRQRLLGLTQQVYYAKSEFITKLGAHNFSLKVPAGEYDVYMVPPSSRGTTCVAPPQLYRNYPIGVKDNAEKPNAAITFNLSAISRLNLLLLWTAKNQSLDGWTVDIIEPSGGNRISTEVVLSGDGTLGYSIPLAYSTVLGTGNDSAAASGNLLRLRPPASLVAPTIFLDRTALGLLQTSPEAEVRLKAFTRYPSQVEVNGQMVRADLGSSVAGTISLISTEIYGVDAGIFASFQTSATVEANGLIRLSLPPGKYRVHGEPALPAGQASDAVLSASEAVWDIPADTAEQHGKVLQLPLVTELSGHAAVVSAEVRAVPSPSNPSPFDEAFGDVSFSPRASSGLVDVHGNFALQVDPGRFDITLQAPEELGFGWFVRPGVQVGERNLEVGSLPLPLPWALTGTASIMLDGEAQPLVSTAIRAYAYLDKNQAYTRDPEQAVSAIQVAATRADEAGRYRLLLPATIGGAK